MAFEAMPLTDFGDRAVDKWALRTVVERGALAFECRNCLRLAHVDVPELIARIRRSKP